MKGYKTAKYLEMDEWGDSGKRESRSLRKRPYRGRSNLTHEREGHPN